MTWACSELALQALKNPVCTLGQVPTQPKLTPLFGGCARIQTCRGQCVSPHSITLCSEAAPKIGEQAHAWSPSGCNIQLCSPADIALEHVHTDTLIWVCHTVSMAATPWMAEASLHDTKLPRGKAPSKNPPLRHISSTSRCRPGLPSYRSDPAPARLAVRQMMTSLSGQASTRPTHAAP